MYLYLLRHGQTVSNWEHQVTGTKESPLTELGRSQALMARKWFVEKRLSFERHICSPWLRARKTAKLALPHANFTVDSRIGETWAGEAAEMPRSDFEKQYPSFFTNFDPDAAFPGGESHSDLNHRVLEWLQQTAATTRRDENVLAVCHMGPISCILQYIFDIPMRSFPRFKPANCSLTCINIPPKVIPNLCELLFFAIPLV